MSKVINHAVIVCHPAPASFTHSVAARYVETVSRPGHAALVRDLYGENFDPVLKESERQGEPAADVQAEWGLLGEPDVVVLVYPVWFGAPPAMLVGYIDRVFGAGRVSGAAEESVPEGPLAGKHLVSLTSSGSMSAWLHEKGVLTSLRTVYDRYLQSVFGFSHAVRYHFDGIRPDLPERDVRQHLLEAEQAAREVMSRFQPTGY